MPAPVRSQQEEKRGKPEGMPPATSVFLPQRQEPTARSAASASNLDAAGAGGGGTRPESGDPRAQARRIRLGAVAGSRARRGNRRLAFRHQGDRGAGTVEVVIAVPLLMLIILVIVQFAVVWYAHAVAQATAEEALAAARVQGGSAAAGEQRAAQVLGQIGSAVLISPQVSVTRSAVSATVQVHAAVERVVPLPGLSLPFTVTVTGPVERFVPETGGG